MFKTTQIITSTQLFRGFSKFIKQVLLEQEPVLITTKYGGKAVLVEANYFEYLVEQSFVNQQYNNTADSE